MFNFFTIFAVLNTYTINNVLSYSPKSNVISPFGVGIKPFDVGDSFYMAHCKRCKQEKESILFHKKSLNKKTGLAHWCKDCCKEYRKNYYSKNKTEINSKIKIYVVKNKDKIIERRKEFYAKTREESKLYSKTYYENNKDKRKIYVSLNRDKINKQAKDKKRNSPLHKLKAALHKRTSQAFKTKRINKNKLTTQLLGIDIEKVKEHIEKQFKKGMNWANHGYDSKCWHIDHIIPLASAKTESELIALCHYTNLQPLWALENMIKSAKIINTTGRL